MTEYEGYVCAPGDAGKIAIIVARFNQTITEKLLEGALAKLREHMVAEDQISVVRVPGCFEIPTIAERFASDEDYIAVICLGCVIKGETSHDEHINRAVSSQLARIGAEYGIPV
ncbi:MAG: 6,7-dimethyl-8-ribityllumazine synthase, partial [Thermoguttaceae bacterium]|nr:6,7-dimethyl-8-ribityllumazine synthase [Thermoguttaceae bacterium]